MVAGELYLATDEELMRGRARARALTARYNATTQDAQGERRELLEELFASVGQEVWIEPPFYCDYGWNIELDDRVFLNFNCVVLDVTPVRVGAGTLVGPAVQLCAATHPLDPREREQMLEYGASITWGGTSGSARRRSSPPVSRSAMTRWSGQGASSCATSRPACSRRATRAASSASSEWAPSATSTSACASCSSSAPSSRSPGGASTSATRRWPIWCSVSGFRCWRRSSGGCSSRRRRGSRCR